ncbi:XRE family transcriptional regulator [Serratia marcescens]|uniref:XRE family transcriptional regulator n=1 Tax=Serratia marcescens TaxID=615 RepID=UPI001D00B359|nr:XRE family transcriptional regulator [Serratia marcescens]UTL84020.1 XRE family transcriptional regulator [Serratia marcescens]UYY65626.1 XRE family transcriptional regulator [Serratia marcescens]
MTTSTVGARINLKIFGKTIQVDSEEFKMRLINEYTPPSPNELEKLKSHLGYTGTQMAELAGVASNSQWRKYTGGTEPRAMSPHILFFMSAQLTLSEDELSRVVNKMKDIGAIIK